MLTRTKYLELSKIFLVKVITIVDGNVYWITDEFQEITDGCIEALERELLELTLCNENVFLGYKRHIGRTVL